MDLRCDICDLNLTCKYDYKSHMAGKKHKKNEEAFKFKEKISERSIYVTHLPHTFSEREIIEFFRQFGDIETFFFGPQFLIIEFKHKNPVDQLVNNPVYFNNYKLLVRRRNREFQAPSFKAKQKDKTKIVPAINDSEDLNFDNIRKHLEEKDTFDSQLGVFLNQVALTTNEVIDVYELTCLSLNNIFRMIYPECTTYRFGSTVTGLGFKNCDLDIYLDPGFPVINDQTGHDDSPRTSSKCFKCLKKLMFSKPHIFSEIVPILRANTPIIKFKYLPRGVSCDISIKNSLAVHNSQLVRHYLTINHNLRAVMLIIKYGLRNYELKSGPKLSTYACAMLFIFYLQQPPLQFPTIFQLKQDVDKDQKKFVEFWQVNYVVPILYVNSHSGNNYWYISVPKLLHGFYEFYSKFNFMEIICPLDGTSYPKSIFSQPDQLPDSMVDYKLYLEKTRNEENAFLNERAMYVQDPFELSRNITGNVTSVALKDFQRYCIAATEICVSSEMSMHKNLLPLIFSISINKPVHNKNYSYVIISSKNFLKVGLPDDFELSTDVPDKERYMMNSWYNLTLQLVKRYLEGVLKLQVSATHDGQMQKQQKIEGQSDVHSEIKKTLIFTCTGNYCLWRQRKGNFQSLDPSLSVLEKDVAKSNVLYEVLVKKNVEKVNIKFSCEFEKRNDPVDIFLVFRNDECSKSLFSELIQFIKFNLPVVITKTFQHMLQFKRTSIE